jgi:hypothetical protein
MITPSFGLTATERVLPRLALDWTTGVAQAGVDVVRSGVATFVGSNGLIQSASANTQRIDYSTGLAGLLVEEARTNLLIRSDDLGNNSVWSKNAVTPSYDSINSPDGTQNADIFLETTTTTQHGISTLSGVTITAGAPATAYFFVKANGRDQGRILIANGTFSVSVVALFNLTTGIIDPATQGAGSGSTSLQSSILALADGWYRVSISAVVDGVSTNIKASIVFSNGSSLSYAGDVTKGMAMWAGQIEQGAFPTSYIPTEATTVTRNADVATMTGTNFSDWFNAAQGSVSVDSYILNATSGTAPRIFAFLGAGGPQVDEMSLFMFSTTGKLVSSNTFNGGVNTGRIDAFPSYATNTEVKAAFSYGANTRRIAAIGTTTTTSTTSFTIPTCTSAAIGNSGGSNQINGYIRKLNYYPIILTASETQAFTK